MIWEIVQTTGPTEEPITIAQARAQSNRAAGLDDARLYRLIGAARQSIELATGYVMLEQTFEQRMTDWPEGDFFHLMRRPIASGATPVSSVKWLDTTGSETTLTVNTDYLVDTAGGRIILPYSKTWPSGVLYPNFGVRVVFKAGHDSVPKVPAPLIQAALLLLSTWDTYREDAQPLPTLAPLPWNIDSLLVNFRHPYSDPERCGWRKRRR